MKLPHKKTKKEKLTEDDIVSALANGVNKKDILIISHTKDNKGDDVIYVSLKINLVSHPYFHNKVFE